MKVNMGNVDRTIRFILGALIIALGFYFKSWWGVVGIVLFLTALVNHCPTYNLIGVSTNSKVKTEKLKV